MMNQYRKMFLLSSLLLASLCSFSSWSVSSLAVIQTPEVSVMEGEMVNITCCWTATVGRARLTWFKNQTIIQKEMVIRPEQSEKEQSINCSTYTFPNISRRDSGIYICSVNVEIPYLATYKGEGTIITVVAREDSRDNTSRGSSSGLPVPAIIALVVVAPLLLIAVICFFFLRRNQGHAARVIYEVPHFDSEQAETDKHSTGSSRGSSQWCQVPVYDSLDYFEQVETKRSE